MNSTIEGIYQKAKSNPKKIVLVEPQDERIQKAAKIATDQKIAQIIMVKNPAQDPLFNQLAQELYQIRKEKGLTATQAKELIKNPLYFGTMMVQLGLADGMVAGATNTTQETFRPALQIIKTKPGEKLISSFFIIEVPNTNFGQNGIFLFADCGLNIDPTDQELAQIALQSAKSFRQIIGQTPKIAMLSYSTNNSSTGPSVDKVRSATQIVKNSDPSLIVEGEIQSDAAIIPSIAVRKFTKSQLQGLANILIFPDLNSGNIAYKLVERLANAHAFGPLTQGINKPINDLSRGCDTNDIVTTIAITSVQAMSN